MVRPFNPLWILVLSLLTFAMAHADRFPLPEFDPKTYTSPSGEYSLRVEPGNRMGSGPGRYSLQHKGQAAWSNEHPFTFWDARVTDRGETVGYAYTSGLEAMGGHRTREYGDLVIAVLNPDGTIRRQESHERHYGDYMIEDEFPHPIVQGILLDAENDRFFMRTAHEALTWADESWWTYCLSTGAPLHQFEPRRKMPDFESARMLLAAEPVAATPLILLHWWHSDKLSKCVGARFTLIDPEGNMVWSLLRESDYSAEPDENKRNALRHEMRETGAILRANQPREFELRFVSENKRVRFSVNKNGEAWEVAEISREEYAAPEKEDSFPASEVPEGELAFLGEIELRTGEEKQAPTPVVRDILDFTFDDRGNPAFLRNANATTSAALVLVSPQGAVLGEKALDTTGLVWRHLAFAGGKKFLLISSPRFSRTTGQAFWVDLANNTSEKIESFDAMDVRGADAFPDGTFVVLHHIRENYSRRSELVCFDARGRRQWVVSEGDSRSSTTIFSVEAVAINSEGEIAVLEKISNQIKVFRKDGKPVKTISLEQAWGRKPRYPTLLVRDFPRGYVMRDFLSDYYRLDSDGAIRTAFALRHADGFAFTGEVRVAPDGQFWATDKRLLMPLQDDGTALADGALGTPRASGALEKPALLAVDRKGAIHAVEKRTKSVYVFHPDGSLKHICRPRPEEVAGPRLGIRLGIGDAGDVYLNDHDNSPPGFLHFSSTGENLGFMHFPFPIRGVSGHFRLPETHRWVADYNAIHLLDAENRIVQTIEKTPEGNWLTSILRLRIAGDGSFAALTPPPRTYPRPQSPNALIHLYSPAGEPLRTLHVPQWLDTYPQIAYDGQWLVLCSEWQVLLMTAQGRPVMRFPTGTKDDNWQPFLVRDGRELWMYDGKSNVLKRYAMPARE